MSRRIHFARGAAALALCVTSWAHAGNYSCVGKVQQVTVDPNGSVNTSFDFGNGTGMAWMYACNLNEAVAGVSTAACKGIYATLVAAKLSDRPVMMWFNNASDSCTAPSWGYLKDIGWHWGPSIQ